MTGWNVQELYSVEVCVSTSACMFVNRFNFTNNAQKCILFTTDIFFNSYIIPAIQVYYYSFYLSCNLLLFTLLTRDIINDL